VHIVVDGHAGPSLAQDGLAIRFDFAERDGLHARRFETEAEPADA
jgi:hypothetical protein